MKFNTKLDKNETIDKEVVKLFLWGGGFNVVLVGEDLSMRFLFF